MKIFMRILVVLRPEVANMFNLLSEYRVLYFFLKKMLITFLFLYLNIKGVRSVGILDI